MRLSNASRWNRRLYSTLLRGKSGRTASSIFVILALLACVLVPLPTLFIDFLLSLSMASSIVLLLASIQIEHSSYFLSFPPTLLIITLVRLAINLSTTRLILSQADAGQVIDAFAGLVVQNDIIVGAVMFLILTALQYFVIAKGAERVAEVSARFALDALPGHQSSIEADLQNGFLTPTEAAERRAQLIERSNFFGRMDGAIRFVKGDAGIGILVVGVNLIGGIAIGINRHDLSFSQSLSTFGRLSIGDGLVAQIPALLVSLSAGILVARVDREAVSVRPRWLQPNMFVAPAFFLGFIAIVPGMPSTVFIITALLLLITSMWISKRNDSVQFRPKRNSIHFLGSMAMIPSALEVERTLAGIHQRCQAALGISFPRIRIRYFDHHREHIDLRYKDRLIARIPIKHPLTSNPQDSTWIEIYRNLMIRSPQLVELSTVEQWLDKHRLSNPILVRNALRALEAPELLCIVRGFLRDRIPLPPFVAILDYLAEQAAAQPSAHTNTMASIEYHPRGPQQRDLTPWLEEIRIATSGYWLPDIIDGLQTNGSPKWLRPTPDFEDLLLNYSIQSRESSFLVNNENTTSALKVSILNHRDGAKPLAIVTHPGSIRQLMSQLLQQVHPFIPVISTKEFELANLPFPSSILWIEEPSMAQFTE